MSAANQLPGERGVSPVAAPPALKRRHKIALGVIGLAGIAAYVLLHHPAAQKKAAEDKPVLIRQSVDFEPPGPIRATPINLPMPISKASQQQPMPEQQTGDPLQKARDAPLLLGGNQPRPAQLAAMQGPAGRHTAGVETDLGAKLKPTVLEGTKATVLPHPEFTITAGTMIPCVLLTAMDSTAPGIVTCRTEADAVSTTGDVVLLERGTKLVGEYSSHVQQGQARLFVLWTRAETPHHVIITLNSPGADSLGRSGFPGQVDNHFWARMGAALMFTAVDGLFSVGTALASKAGTTYLNLGTGQGAADAALQGNINIPPTIRVHQGAMIAVMVARDLDFSGVYQLSMGR